MPRRHEWHSRIKAVEREYQAVRLAIDYFHVAVRRNPLLLKGDVRPRDIGIASNQLEGTYVMRIFAQFETGLREYWATVRKTHPKVEALLNNLARDFKIPFDYLEKTHAVRKFRNYLVHERDVEAVVPIPITDVRSALQIFFKYLPPEW
jgi:hypothetical protein